MVIAASVSTDIAERLPTMPSSQTEMNTTAPTAIQRI